jgi:hypothetical protein
MGAFSDQNYGDRSVPYIFTTNLAHHVLCIVAVDEIVVIKGAERFRGKDLFNRSPSVNECIRLGTVTVKRRNENVSLRWRQRDRRKGSIPTNLTEASHDYLSLP